MTREALDLCCGFFQSTYGHVDGSRTTERSVPSRNANLGNVSVIPFDFKSKAYLHMVACIPSVRVHSISVAQMSRTSDGTKFVRVTCTRSVDVHFKTKRLSDKNLMRRSAAVRVWGGGYPAIGVATGINSEKPMSCSAIPELRLGSRPSLRPSS